MSEILRVKRCEELNFILEYFFVSIIEPSTGVILSAHIEVCKVPLPAGHGVHRDVIPVTEASCNDDFLSIADGTGVAGNW